jgi:amino acid transporter
MELINNRSKWRVAVTIKNKNENNVIRTESKKLKRELTLLPLFGLIYFTVCGGSFGAEPMVGWSGPGLAILLFFVTPLLFSIPNMLMVREMQSMMPVEGGYYHWLKKAFGPFVGFMGGWMNWVVAWVDVSIYPVLAAYYLGYFIPALREGATIGGVFISSTWLSFLVAVVLIWGVSYLNMRGARLSGLTTNWLGAVMMVPLILMSILGLISWIKSGVTISLPFLPGGAEINMTNVMGALSTGIFVAMWNFMGWELPTAAGDEIVNPKKTYPIAMVLVLITAIATYTIPTITGLYGGAGENGKYQLWGIEEYDSGVGIAPVLEEYGVPPAEAESWGVDLSSSVGWEFPDIAHAVADKLTGQTNGTLAKVMGGLVTFSAVLSMIGLFIGNGLGGTRVPFAMAEDGMMPKFLVKVHPKYGTPWVSILFCAMIFSIFSLSAFAALVVIDVFLNMIVLMAEFFALWKLRFSMPEIPRKKVPGGYIGLALVTLAPLSIILLAIYSQFTEEGMTSISWALVAMAIGVILYFPLKKWTKPGVPDVDPFVLTEDV